MTPASSSDWLKLPNLLAYARMLVVVLVVLLYYAPWEWSHYMAAALFTLAALTDWLDGYLARNWQMKTRLGEFLDPVADKLLVAMALVLMVQAYDNIWVTSMVMIILGREMTVISMRHWAAGMESSLVPKTMRVNIWSKTKTVLQMCSIIWFLAFPPERDNWLPAWIAIIILAIATVMTLWSAFIYARALIKDYAKE